MQIITGIEPHQWKKSTAVTLGKFDGLHRGHQKLVNRIMEYKSPECDSVLCAFDMGRESLMTKDERRKRLEGKIDYLVEYPFTKELREMEAEDFIDQILCDTFHASHIVVGYGLQFRIPEKGGCRHAGGFRRKPGLHAGCDRERTISGKSDQQQLYPGSTLPGERLNLPASCWDIRMKCQEL